MIMQLNSILPILLFDGYVMADISLSSITYYDSRLIGIAKWFGAHYNQDDRFSSAVFTKILCRHGERSIKLLQGGTNYKG